MPVKPSNKFTKRRANYNCIPVGPVISPLPTPITYLSPFASARTFEDDSFVRVARSKAATFPSSNPRTLEARNMLNTSSDRIENMTKPALRRAGVRGGEIGAIGTATSQLLDTTATLPTRLPRKMKKCPAKWQVGII